MAVTIAFAAGIINAGVVFLQLTFPLLVVFLLVAVLPLENNAITWSVVGRQLQGSFWPLILRSDSTSSSKVQTRVLILSAGSTAGLILLAVAAVLTPLGLYQSITSPDSHTASFVYIPDLTPIGRATRSHQDYRTSRLCDGAGAFGWTYTNCPGQEHGIYFFKNATGAYVNTKDDASYLSSVPPTNLTRVFESGRDGDMSTVASSFDIQYRSYVQITTLDPNSSLGVYNTTMKWRIDEYRPRSAARFYVFQSYMMTDDWVVVDGLVANMKTGGVAFRNHTIPSRVGARVEWNESLLWVEPESACVDLNLTYQWITPQNREQAHPMIVDNGGIVNLTRVYPYLDLNDTQSNPQLQGRAWKGAVLSDLNWMRYFNASRNSSSIGKPWMLDPVEAITLTSRVYLDSFASLNTSFSFKGKSLSPPPNFNYSNDPTRLFIPISTVVRGFGGADFANISNIVVDGGILMGAPVKDTESSNYVAEEGSRWHAPLYSCVSALKASVMDFTFVVNGTSGLSDMTIKRAEPRRYPSRETSPVWAVEDTGFKIAQLTPAWGIVGDQYENAPGLQTRRGESLYLPAGSLQIYDLGLSNAQSEAWGPAAAQAALTATYSCALKSGVCDSLPDYTGRLNYPMLTRWQNYTKSATTAHKIFDLAWTDVMINYVTSRRGRLTPPGDDDTNTNINSDVNLATAPVLMSDNTIKYHMPFAVPGIIFLVCYLLIVVAFLFLLCAKRATFSTLRSLSNQTAVGRAMTIERYNGKYEVQAMSTKNWIEKHGDANLLIKKQSRLRPSEKLGSEDSSNHEVEVMAPMIPKAAER